ncbi:hypothetical protein HWA77_23645 [Photobacterium damselae subsp. damselae]|uniref:Uncharacterized protein n=1 Tax=Photobacterium damselae subsp. damselae TaxID=85581 RepID=A0A850R3X4_PHODD|nr:hypothetical protein [Photobacterium damselae subsp. damselae]
MDKNTFWSQTAPSYDLLEYDDESSEIRAAATARHADENFSLKYTVVSFDDEEDDPVIEVRVFRTASVELEDRRERKFHWFNRKK